MVGMQFFSPDNQMEAKRRLRLAESLRAASQEPQAPAGTVVAQSPLSAMARGIMGGIGSYQEDLAEQSIAKDAYDRQKFLSSAVQQYGSDPKMLAQALMTQPSMVDAGLGLYGDAIKGDQMTAYQAAILGLQGKRFNAEYQTNPDTGEVEPRPKIKQLPSSLSGALLENRSNLAKAQDALALVKGNTIVNASGEMVKGAKDSTGWKGYLPEGLLQRIDPEGVAPRAAVADLGSMIIHDRSGTAVTAAEYPRLKPFIPKETDNQETVVKKLTRFVGEYERITREAAEFYAESGYKVPEQKIKGGNVVPDVAPSAPSGTEVAPPTPEELAEYYRITGGR